MSDEVNHPSHYTSHPSGVECIDITRHMTFNIGNALKYLWRAGLKSEATKTQKEKHVQDLQKAAWYINDEISKLIGEITDDTQTEIDFEKAGDQQAVRELTRERDRCPRCGKTEDHICETG